MEPASCAAQMLDRISPKLGSSVLVFGSGPAGLLLSQLLRLNGASRVVIASLPGAKLNMARKIGAADEFVELSGSQPEPALADMMQRHSRGFEVVVEATGVPNVLEDSINYVRRGGKLAVFGVYSSAARVNWPPCKILANQISVVGSIAEMIRFPAAVDYLDSKKVKVDGFANKAFRLEQWAECLESMRLQDTVKAAIVFD